MSQIYAIDSVRIDAQSRYVSRVRWGRFDTDEGVWISGPNETDVIEIVDKILSGTEVWAIPPDLNMTPWPKLRVIVGGHGDETIMLSNITEKYRLSIEDLRRF